MAAPLAVRGRMIHDQGAYTPQGINLPYNASTALPAPTSLPAYEIDVAGGRDQQGRDHAGARCRLSGGRVRHGAVLDAIAGALKLDRAEVRRRNLVPPDRFPTSRR